MPTHRISAILLTLLAALAPATGQEAARFLAAVEHASSPQAQAALADSFFAAHPKLPVVEDSLITFFYRGAGKAVAVPGELNGWDPSEGMMRRVGSLDLFTRTDTLARKGRAEYKMWVDSVWMLDPANPRTSEGGVGSNSEVTMPDYEEFVLPPDSLITSRGTIDTLVVPGRALGHSHPVYLYKPKEIEPRREYALIVVTDGQDYLRFARMAKLLDVFIQYHLMAPVVAAFVDPRSDTNDPKSNHRMEEYAASDDYLAYLADDVIPAVEKKVTISKNPQDHLILGASMGGIISTYAVLRRPDLFAKCLAQSPAYLQAKGKVIDMVKEGRPRKGTFLLQTGSLHDTQSEAMQVYEGLKKSGATVFLDIFPEGHNWKNWYNKLGGSLAYFFPYNDLR